jgi:hypothetical protein
MLGVAGYIVEAMNGAPGRAHMRYLATSGFQFERTPAFDETCEALSTSLLGRKPSFNYCRANRPDGAKKTLVVIGDSHAHAIYPGFADVAKARGYQTLLFANSSCPPLIGFDWGDTQEKVEECRQRVEEILTMIERLPDVHKVVMTSRAPVYFHGEVERPVTEAHVVESLRKTLNPALTYKTFSQGLAATSERITRATSADLYYILENPELGFHPKEAVNRPFAPTPSAFSVDANLYELRMRYYRKTVSETSAPGLQVLDPGPLLCANGKCKYVDGEYLYADDDHFSVYGSRYIAKRFEDVLFADD